MPLIYLSTAWMAGIYLSSHLDAAPGALFGLLSTLPLAIAWLWRRNAHVRLAALCVLFCLLGALRYTLAQPRLDEHSVSAYNDRGEGVLTGVVVAEPDVRDTYTNLRLRSETLALEGERPVEVEGLVLLSVPRYPEHLYGDRLRVRGTLETPPVFDTFSYREYLARQGVYSTVRWAQVTTLGRDQANRLYALLLQLKMHAHAVISDVLPEPSASLLAGILLGIEGGIPAALLADFKATGTSHIIAISGFNMALVGGLFSTLSVRLVGRRHAAWFASAAIALYTLLVGGSAAVVRAAVMSLVAVWGQHFGRQNSALNALFATALFMTAWNPNVLWDLGFQLSFAATLGMLCFSASLQQATEDTLARVLPVRWSQPVANLIHEPVVQSTCCQVTTMPIILYTSRTLSVVTALSNALILPLQTQVKLWGAAATVGGLLWRPLGRVLGWAAWLPLTGTIRVVEWTARMRYAAVALSTVRPAAVVAWYAFVGAVAWLLSQRPERRREVWRAAWQALSRWFSSRLLLKAATGGLAIAAVLVWLAVAALPDGRLHVAFLNVPGGDATYIETPAGQQVLINGGSSPAGLLAQLGRCLPFYDRTLDLIVLSDDRPGHLDGLLPALERYHVQRALYAPQACTRPACVRWKELLDERGGGIVRPVPGLTMDLDGDVRLTVLYPAGEHTSEEDVLVLRIEYGQTCFLLLNGAGGDVERALLAGRQGVRCDVLQTGTRKDTLSAAFLEAVQPALVVLAGDVDAGVGETESKTLERQRLAGTTIALVGERGSIEVVSDGQEYDVLVRH